MISVTVNGTKVGIEDSSMIAQQVDRRRAGGSKVCVKVEIDEGGINMILSIPHCPRIAVANRRARPPEERLFNLWEKLGLDKDSFAGGQVVAFLKQVPSLLP
jgi:hypothetical protein